MKEYNYVRKTARYNGKKYEATGKTELEAMTKLAEKLAAAKRGEESIGGGMTVNAWFEQWFTAYKEPKGLTPKSLGMYREKYNGYIRPRIGHLKLREIKDIHLQKILNEQAGMSFSHVQKLRQVMQSLFKRARQSRLIPYDPAELLELPQTTKGTRRSVTEEERSAILAVAEGHKAGLWILTLLYTGMRPGETVGLMWSDVDFEHNENSMRRLWTGFRRDLDIYMGAEVYRNKIIKSVVADDLTPYCLRHTFCMDLQRAGVSLNVAKELMGHSDIQTTANIYTHRDQGILHAGIALLDGSKQRDEQQSAEPVGKVVGIK